ncbi:hypothetical protein E2C01_084003 [Portunus trituberculatus]|uniref:Uncharacterized protein n=1 Tax=Portunus trituberculatus TaxID=210409 RepID=A0A5B7J2W0_PORTR|nr:hypothetical protein [Portunus trituberculatus]
MRKHPRRSTRRDTRPIPEAAVPSAPTTGEELRGFQSSRGAPHMHCRLAWVFVRAITTCTWENEAAIRASVVMSTTAERS